MKALLPVFDIANQALQKDEPVIHVLHSVLTDQLKDLLMRFVLPKVMCENANALHKVPFAERVYQVEDSNLFVGTDASDFIIEHKSQLIKKSFYESFRPSMSTKTLSSLLVHKVSINAKGTTCFQQKHSRAFLATAKSATYQNLQDK